MGKNTTDLLERLIVGHERAANEHVTYSATIATLRLARDELLRLYTPQPRRLWTEQHGPVLWWRDPVNEPPYCGTPLDDDFPEHVTHWTPVPEPFNKDGVL